LLSIASNILAWKLRDLPICCPDRAEMPNPLDLKGERIKLRGLMRSDWPAIHAYASRPDVCRFQPWGPNTPEETITFVEAAVASAEEDPRRRYALAVILAEEGKVIGLAELNVRDAQFAVGEIAYVLHPDYWGRGIATEAARILLRFGFVMLGLHRVYATCDPRNVASSRVMEKIGMQYEGRLRETMLIRDGWRDSLMYAILAEEWEEYISRGKPTMAAGS
jgi:RimJ/RimL family protein N-acetyltransferase